jgi:hypothetical protein
MISHKRAYSERTDLEKVQSNWKKAVGLYSRKEWSTVIMRSVTAVELAANYVIRKELIEKRKLENEFVDHLMIWANGIRGKFEKLILPLAINAQAASDLKKVKKKIDEINMERNSIAHSGQFKQQSTAKHVLQSSREIIETLVQIYESDFSLKGNIKS